MKEVAESFKKSSVRAIEDWKLNKLELFAFKRSVETISSGCGARYPHGDLLVTMLSENHALH